MIKLVVGIDNLEDFYQWQAQDIVDYEGVPANTVRTRYQPKDADKILQTSGSIYRVMKRRIMCRQKILGFEKIESADKGTQCLILTEPEIIQTYLKPHRPFQGWRYFQPEKAPKDRGLYLGGGEREEIEPEMEQELRDAGLM